MERKKIGILDKSYTTIRTMRRDSGGTGGLRMNVRMMLNFVNMKGDSLCQTQEFF